MAAVSIAGRSMYMRSLVRTTATRRISGRILFSLPSPSFQSNSSLRYTRISSPRSLMRLLRRELSTLQPIHSAIASARLVSKLPRDASTRSEVE